LSLVDQEDGSKKVLLDSSQFIYKTPSGYSNYFISVALNAKDKSNNEVVSQTFSVYQKNEGEGGYIAPCLSQAITVVNQDSLKITATPGENDPLVTTIQVSDIFTNSDAVTCPVEFSIVLADGSE
jgi:hypothetical protein